LELRVAVIRALEVGFCEGYDRCRVHPNMSPKEYCDKAKAWANNVIKWMYPEDKK